MSKWGADAAGSLESGMAGSVDKGTLSGEMATGEAGSGELAPEGEESRGEPALDGEPEALAVA